MNEMYGKKVHLTQLYDFYGNLLTKRQQEIFEMYHMNDFSLAEIASSLDISRNAVFDTLKKVEASLDDYEEKLKLSHLYQIRMRLLNDLKEHTDQFGLDLIEQLEGME
ncbi:MAG TPA: sigma factor-like helix-turn-helix DNA-binding protein [Bacilli bacterium]|nr:sigma factor-like helix-turn-helix DNA-binding protein [Bacilli bacterium]